MTPVQLLSIHPFVNYVTVHLLITALVHFLDAPTAKLIDTMLIVIDGALRTHAVVMSVQLAKASAVGAVSSSMLIQVVCGTLGATGGGQLAGTLGVHLPGGWQFSTPPALRATSVTEVIDVLAAGLCALVYGITTLSHPGYSSLLSKVHHDGTQPLFSPVGARAACTLIFTLAFAYRAVQLHWLPATASVSPAPSGRSSTKKNGVETPRASKRS